MQISFAVHVQRPDESLGRILGVRHTETHVEEHRAADMRFLQGDMPDAPVPCLAVERAVRGSLATATAFYTIDADTVEYLGMTGDAVLAEDSCILRNALEGPLATLAERSTLHQQVLPLRADVARLRANVKALQDDNRTLREQLAQQAALAAALDTSPVRKAPAEDAIMLHSPQHWELETEAAVNARTRYDANRTRHQAAHRLDHVTQQRLVERLHDQSVDSRRRRLQASDDHGPQGAGSERRTLSLEEQQQLGTRLHDEQHVRRKRLLDELDKEVYPPVERRVFTPSDIAKSNARIYQEPIDKKQKDLAKLYDTYLYSLDDKLPKLKLSPAQQEAMADRLSKQ